MSPGSNAFTKANHQFQGMTFRQKIESASARIGRNHGGWLRMGSHGSVALRLVEVVFEVMFCLGVFLSEPVRAQDADFNLRLWQVEDGLPHNIVHAVTQTRDGYLWVGTREGLARFDGERFQTLTLIPEKIQPAVLCLLGAKDGSLWIGTEKSGLFRFHDGKIERCDFPNTAPTYDVFQLCENVDGSIWIEISHKIFRWENGRMELRAKFELEQLPFCLDDEGKAWLFDNGLKEVGEKKLIGYPVRSGSMPGMARSLYRDHDGEFWIGPLGGGLVKVKKDAAQRTIVRNVPAEFVGVIFRDSAGNLWAGTYAGLCRVVDGQLVNMRPLDDPSYRIYSIYEDREKNLWVGSEEGLTRLTPLKFRTITKKNGLAGNRVVTVCPSRDGGVWISSWGDGLNHLVGGKTTMLTKTNGLSSNFIMAMTEGHDGSLWAGTDYSGRLNHIQNGNITHLPLGVVNTALFEDDHGTLWIGARDSLQCWDGRQITVFTNMNGKKINALCGGENGGVWIGTDNGLSRWHDGRFDNLATKDPQLGTAILSLYADAANTLWIGTRRDGLLRWKNEKCVSLTSSRGLLSDSIYAILEDAQARLWFNSSRGIFWVDKAQLEDFSTGKRSNVTSISYGKADGILINGQFQEVTQPAACKTTDGRLWFRMTQGVAVVDPDKITINQQPPPTVIQEIVADKMPVYDSLVNPEPSGRITIRPGHRELEIHYAGLSFSAPEKNQFRYKLDGVDADWVNAGTRRVAFYNNMRPGQYHFKVISANNDGIWNEQGAAITLVFQPYFWQTNWFLAVALIGLTGLAGGTTRYLTRRRMQRKLEILERQNAVEKERARIARDMHDELGAKLTRISFQGATARRRLSNPPEAEQQIEKMSETARELVQSLDQIVWAVDPKNDTLESLAGYLCRYTGEFVENSALHCEFMIPPKLPDCRLSTEVRHNVFLAVKELINNAVKHSGARRLTLTIRAGTEEFEIVIADDGRGMAPATAGGADRFARAGHGLINVRERLTSIRGHFELHSEPGRGTEARLIVPLRG
jgi:ligand-binding sensor domain-containing protein/signal transduction histidine kinase